METANEREPSERTKSVGKRDIHREKTDVAFIFQINAIRKTSKFEDEIRLEQEERKKEEEEKRKRQAAFKDRASVFGNSKTDLKE
jgi:hypothetical protein